MAGFWAITLYSDQGFMVNNPIDRYSIGDRTSGLVHHANGDVEISIQPQDPGRSGDVNGLPSPSGEPFYLVMRLYIPDEAVLDRHWQPPAITALPQISGCSANSTSQL